MIDVLSWGLWGLWGLVRCSCRVLVWLVLSHGVLLRALLGAQGSAQARQEQARDRDHERELGRWGG